VIDAKTFRRYAADPAAFRADLLIDVDGVARRFGSVQDEWQRQDFAALDPALRRAAGRGKGDAKGRAYLERPRGHSKTTDLAIIACWALAFSTRPLRGYCYAADKDQARLLRDAMLTLIRLNPWLAEILSVETHRIVNFASDHPGEGGSLTIETSDVGSSYGILPDLIIADELVHWTGDGSLWHSLLSSAAKRRNCLLVVISNAGFVDSWAWKVREAARTDPDWFFSRLDGPRASWLPPDRLAEQRRMLPAVAYARLWENQWSTGGGDALLPNDIEAAFDSGLSPMTGNERGYSFVAGVDLGLTRDCSAVVALGVKREGDSVGKIRLAAAKLWNPRFARVSLVEVERELRDLHARFDLNDIRYDPWQAEHLAQRLRLDGFPMNEVSPTGGNLQSMATAVIESFTDRRLELYPCAELKRDLMKLRVEERSYGFRLVAPRDETGHGDTGTAFALALLAAIEIAGQRIFEVGILDVWNHDAEALAARRMWAGLMRSGGSFF
jgi:hypothetical protein